MKFQHVYFAVSLRLGQKLSTLVCISMMVNTVNDNLLTITLLGMTHESHLGCKITVKLV